MACIASGKWVWSGVAMTTASMASPDRSSIVRKSRNRGADGNSSRASLVCDASRSTSHRAATAIGFVVANVLSISRPRLPMPANASLSGRSAGTKAAGRCGSHARALAGSTDQAAAVPSAEVMNRRRLRRLLPRLLRRACTWSVSVGGRVPGHPGAPQRPVSYRLRVRRRIPKTVQKVRPSTIPSQNLSPGWLLREVLFLEVDTSISMDLVSARPFSRPIETTRGGRTARARGCQVRSATPHQKTSDMRE